MSIVSKNKKTALIQGGPGVERDISLITSKTVKKSLDELGISPLVLEADESLSEKLQKHSIQRAFLAVHGPFGEDGTLQGILEHLKIPYTGSGVLASSICMDKIVSKKWMNFHGILNPDFLVLGQKNKKTFYTKDSFFKQDSTHRFFKDFSDSKIHEPPVLPCIVKPNRSGSSLGISLCRLKEEWPLALEKAFKIDSKVLVEPYIDGKEVAVSWLDGKTLTPVEVKPPEKHFYDFKRKYEKNQTQYFTPPQLDSNLIKQVQSITCEAAQVFKIRFYFRMDFIIDQKQNIFALELNTLPGLTPLSLFPLSAKHDGLSYNQLILKILENAALDY